MINQMNYISLVAGAALLAVILHLVRTKRLSEKYSLLWLFSALVMILLSVWRGLLDVVAHIFGIYYPPSFLFLVALFLSIMMGLHFSIVITKLSDRSVRMAQEIALLKDKIRELEGKDKR
ncbi:MAG: DUF2304 domain-containing protein [Candidatus Omnitrophica bacterium]|nr:DUF2304 domain-containing protein [Candidatus Omnitrophota bacterium]